MWAWSNIDISRSRSKDEHNHSGHVVEMSFHTARDIRVQRMRRLDCGTVANPFPGITKTRQKENNKKTKTKNSKKQKNKKTKNKLYT